MDFDKIINEAISRDQGNALDALNFEELEQVGDYFDNYPDNEQDYYNNEILQS